jgi:DNA helicase HerA-like ATPase
MRGKLFSAGARTLYLPGGHDRAIVRPDLRHVFVPRLSGTPLGAEVDYDDLIVHSTYRAYESDRPGEVRYLMYELSQRLPGEAEYQYFFKAVRLAKVTRVPRYLRQSSAAGPGIVIDQQRDLLAALREQGVLFLNIMAKSDDIAMLFCYGVQAVGEDPYSAQIAADEAWAALTTQLDGLYQQLEYKPLNVAEGEALVRYQNEWGHLAMGRGRPLPNGTSLSSSSMLDGNRTDVENTLNQLEAFLRGMSNRNFILSLVTVPVSSVEMTLAWKNITTQLSKVRSEQQGSRSFTAGVALPLSFGSSLGKTAGNTHGVTTTQGLAASDGVSQSLTDGVAQSNSVGSSLTHGVSQGSSATDNVSHGQTSGQSATDSVTHGQSIGQSQGITETRGVSLGLSEGFSETRGVSLGLSEGFSETRGVSLGLSEGVSESRGVSLGLSEGFSESLGRSLGFSRGVSDSSSLTEGVSTSQSSSLGNTLGTGSSWSSNIGQSLNAGSNQSGSWNVGSNQGSNVGVNLSGTKGDSSNTGTTTSNGGNVSGGIPGILDGGSSTSTGGSSGTGTNASNTIGANYGGSSGSSSGVSGSYGTSLGQGVSWGESLGGSNNYSFSATNSVGLSNSLTAGRTLGTSESLSEGLSFAQGRSLGVSQGESFSLGQSLAVSQSESLSMGRSLGVSQSESLSMGRSLGVSQSESLSLGHSLGVSQSESLSMGRSLGVSQSESISQGRSVGVNQGESLSQGQSLSNSNSVSRAASSGTAQSFSQNQALSDAYSAAMSRAVASTNSIGAVPSFGVSISKATFDEAKRIVGDVLEAQSRRYMEGVESGGYFYQMFLQTPDKDTLLGASALLKAAFWGPGSATERLPQPFHTISDFDTSERTRLLDHARALTFYRRREPEIELIEPYVYSSYVTSFEAATFSHPPTAESIGLLAVHDSMPVMSMPADRAHRDLRLGRLVNGERGHVTDLGFGLDVDEVTHTLIAGTTGSGKTTTLMSLLAELTKVSRTVPVRRDPSRPEIVLKEVKAGIVGLDWMSNMRDLASIVEPDRYRFYSLAHPELGAFRWNPLAVPDVRMNPVEWANDIADQMTISFNLGEFGRSLIAEFLAELYTANRLEPYTLMPAKYDESGALVRDAILLAPIDSSTLPASAIRIDPLGRELANVFTCQDLSRLLSMEHLATLVAAKVEELATPEGARLYGTAMRDRLQSLWRRLQYFAPGSPFAGLLASDERLDEPTCVSVSDLIDPERGLVSIIEADGLDLTNRRFILGSVLLAIWRFGQFHGPGVFDNGGKGPGTFVCLEEAHELFGPQGEDEDAFSASTRTQLFESLFRRARALGMKITAVVQNCGSIPEAVTSNVSTVFVHRQYADSDRKRVFSLLNWSNVLGQQVREWRYLGEMARGYCIARLDARDSYLESAPIHFRTDPPALSKVSDLQLCAIAKSAGRSIPRSC